jgi:3-hydroxyacyl-CoA dehydrogenase
MPLATLRLHGRTAVITIARPPVNSLNRAVREAMVKHLDDSLSDPRVSGLVVTGGENTFSAGADISEFAAGLAGDAFKSPGLGEICDRIAASRKPIVAAISGTCMGGGLELALACTSRVLAADVRLALPEVKLGLLPGAGGTQRLPRIIGVRAAFKMIISGDTVKASEAIRLGLGSAATGDLLAAAIGEAERLATGTGTSHPHEAPDWNEPRLALEAELAAAVDARKPRSRAESAIVDAIRAAIQLPMTAGLVREFEIFRELIQSPEAKALQYSFFSERTAARVPTAAAHSRPENIGRVAIVGAGTMGSGIAMCVADAGLNVTLIDPFPDALQRGLERIEATYATAVRKGRLTSSESERRRAAITAATTLAASANADLIIEAVPEDLDLKRRTFVDLERYAKSTAVLASNTSTLDINAIANVTGRPEDVVGLHFFSPANLMRLLEVVRTDSTSDRVLATSMAFAKRIGKVPVLARVCDGFIGNRMFEEYCRQAGFLLDEGALPQQIDSALERWGMAMGPLAVLDLAGGDIAWAIRKRRAIEQPDRPYSRIPDLICELGRFGQKTGSGFYQYDASTRQRIPDPAITDLIIRYSSSIGLARREITDEEIVLRCVLALVNEGARIVEEGIAQRASDLDVVYRTGYGFPASRGGPMFAADEMGLDQVIATMQRYARGYQGQFWDVAPLISRCAASRTRLSDAAGMSSAPKRDEAG